MYNNFSSSIPKNRHNTKLIGEIRAEAEALYEQDIKTLPYHNFKLFQVTGSRVEYETDYFDQRKLLCAFSAMALWEEDPKWISKLCDVVWAVCDAYTWALPAHLSECNKPEKIATKIDLFAAETGMALAEIDYLLGERLPVEARERIQYELERRIVKPYLQDAPLYGKSNWAAVCSGQVGSIMIYLGLDEEFSQAKPNIMQNLRDFLDSYTEDGCCLEGSLYWSYGFAFFCYFAELLRQYTNGAEDLFAEEKVKKIAFFGQNIFLSENYTISFSDSPHRMKYDCGFWNLLAEKYDGIVVPSEEYENHFGDDNRYRFASFIRNFFWYREIQTERSQDKRVIMYEDAQWYINKRYSFVFAAKAGHNAEPHNHNDVGSFLLFDNGRYILDDVGWPEYDKNYFTKKRYENLCASSLGHSVPVIDGEQQKSGQARRGRIEEVTDNSFAIEFAAAYGTEKLTELTRSFKLDQDGITITNCAQGTYQRLTERFVTQIKPEVRGHKVYLDEYVLEPKSVCEIQVSSFTFMPRFGIWTGDIENTAYRIDFLCGKEPELVFRLKIISH